ncbi:FAD-binding oxidoreductase [Nodularia sphaerocarpa]|uniref:FAD-binding oxidoreductase n=1 Tax=Nodularia sphaerocarpa TaxID=137816 RepID=UPI001EFB4A11|nr:FAD-binding oxidoreductase [Nodularia sphaerocarpa]MDB9375186.1 FAD-binding oxidoreductase [Nodularia sphaerocarpa CS-585]MDB9380542.1 FAD-binding oxidoreductase [Nodularia sphaerocarpa CS-585A2]ULP71490.1 NADH oxidoreductase HCR [Nodularia sphaerocarpa UHCC 0038]
MLKIRVFNSKTPSDLKEIDLKPEATLNNQCFIGRSQNCHLILNDQTVSRMHAKVSFLNGNYYFADLGSKAGSWINTETTKVNQDYLLKTGDLVRIGAFVLMVVEIIINSGDDTTISDGDQQIIHVNQRPSEPQQINYAPRISANEYMPLALIDPEQMTRWVKGDLIVRCIQVINETHDVKTFRFVADPSVLFTYKPGQFVTLDLEINGEQVLRSYSISSTPSKPHTLEITVKRVPPPPGAGSDIPQGLVSNWLHDNVTVGSEIKLSGPMGKFTCFANPAPKLLLISAGSGITPMMSMSRWICDTGSDCDVFFFHCARSPRDIIFRQELELMSARHDHFHLAISITRKEPGYSWLSMTGRLDAAMLQLVAPDFRERTVYVCGPNAFMEGVKQMLEEIGFPMQNYYEESFGPAKKQKKSPPVLPLPPAEVGLKQMLNNLLTVPSPSLSIERNSPAIASVTAPVPTPTPSASSQTAVLFSKSGKEVTSDGEDSILELAEQEGVKIRSSCRAGSCGACKKRKLQGEIKYSGEPEAIEESEQQEGYILTCISYPIGKVVIDA